jgi:hypothetical protein
MASVTRSGGCTDRPRSLRDEKPLQKMRGASLGVRSSSRSSHEEAAVAVPSTAALARTSAGSQELF